ncbi:MAG TPA: phosphoglucosamine mutase [Nocardioides sp.]|uniref:phosphoglucosamine mutase n=1 Tax=Nocardioides sp. TaxID=35761 RepID=UPI002D7E396C|nr:phosphoglucosamine mutase [Nocardioides sp.]HET6652056.1 phosphoglucosamine mutase [Nocardioides sp.]
MGRIFGTDGVRGVANGHLTAELALDLSVAAAHVLAEAGAFRHADGHRPRAVVGRDTRISGQFLESAVVAGLASAGVDVLLLGVLPTPGVAYLTAALDADLGVMISASHNPMPDNGIKFLARGGVKLDDAIEAAIEDRLREPWERPTGGKVGRVETYDAAVADYAKHLVSTMPRALDGIRVVLDCAHGAASVAGPLALAEAGAEVIAINDAPDGLNINDGCGSTHLGPVQEAVTAHGADVGFALDGDADRCLAVDAAGNVVDGDQLLAVLALAMRDAGTLVKDTVVVTVMSNLGFVQAMRASGIGVRQTKVGDRYVLEAMNAVGYSLGGEQSGHVIMSNHATTGDGILTALHVLARMAERRASLAELAGVMTRLPQVLVNVPGVDKSRADEDAVLAAAVAEAEAELGDTGRVLLRPSGTEPLVRVMVEAETAAQAAAVAGRLAEVVRERLALSAS